MAVSSWLEFDGEILTIDHPEGEIKVTLHKNGTADVTRDGMLMGTLYPFGHVNNPN